MTETLDFQRVSEIQVVADIDWAELWLAPRLPAFREAHPNILFCINGAGDVPLKLGTPDVRVTYGEGRDEPLFTDVLLPVSGPDMLIGAAGRRWSDRGPSSTWWSGPVPRTPTCWPPPPRAPRTARCSSRSTRRPAAAGWPAAGSRRPAPGSP